MQNLPATKGQIVPFGRACFGRSSLAFLKGFFSSKPPKEESDGRNSGGKSRLLPCAILIAVAALLAPSLAFAWPADANWKPILIGGLPLQDINTDANTERNIVSSAGNAAAYYYNDGTDIFFRERLDASPQGGGGQGNLTPFGWGMEFDTDGVLNTYEYLIMIDGISSPEVISIRQNTSTPAKGLDKPGDQAEVELYSVPLNPGVNFRIVAANTSINGTQDYFLDWSLNFQNYLTATGLTPDLPIRTYWGSSNSTQTLTSDLVDASGADTLTAGFSDVITFWGTRAVTGSVSFVDDLAGNGSPTLADISYPLYVKVTDSDLNHQPDVVNTTTIAITTSNGDSMTATVTETGVNTGIFTVSIPTAHSASVTVGDATLQLVSGAVVTATYTDAVDSSIPPLRNQPRTDAITMRGASIAISKTADKTEAVGKDEVVYTITFSNSGTATARIFTATDTLATGFTYKAGSTTGLTTADPAISGQTLTWSGNFPLSSGASATLSFTAIAGGPRGTAYNNASAEGPNFVTVLTGNTAPVQIKAPVVTITKSADPASGLPGQEITYTIHYKNTGDSSAHTLLVIDSVPAFTNYVAGSLRAGDASSTYATATPRTDGAGEASWPEVQGQVSGSTISFTITSLAADDLAAGSGPDEGKAYFKVTIQ